MPQPEPIAGLAFKYIKGTLTTSEEQQLTRWRNIDNINEEFFQMLLTYVRDGTLQQAYEQRQSGIWDKLCQLIPELKDLKK